MSKQSLFPCGQSRREFVWEMGAGFAGVALASQLMNSGVISGKAGAAEPNKTTGQVVMLSLLVGGF